MKYEEQIASRYLETLGFGLPLYEPDGNVPPDFLLSNSIAVEVRRLNKHVEVSGHNEGLEQAEVPLMNAVEKTLRKFDATWTGSTYFVFVHFRRPLPNRKTLVQKLEGALQAFLKNPAATPQRIEVDPTLSIQLAAATPRQNRCFLVGGNNDPDRGGWVVEDYRANIQLCSDEKLGKVADYRYKYQKWWLLLVDFIGYGLDDFDREQLTKTSPVLHSWDKIIVISPSNSRVFEI